MCKSHSMSDGSSRRAFLTRAWRDALQAAPKVTSAVLPGPGLRLPSSGAAQEPANPHTEFAAGGENVVVAASVPDTATVQELLDQATGTGLASRLEPLRELARPSARLTPVPADFAPGRSCFWDPPVQIDLAELAALGVPCGLPRDGLLQFHCDISDEGAGWRGPRDPRAQAVHVPESQLLATDPEAEAWAGSPQALRLSVELSIPRVWSAPVAALELDEAEQRAWQELRVWLAERQGVELFDQVDGRLAVDRLFGYPDERTGGMPLLCELLAQGVPVDGEPGAHPMAPTYEPLAGRWRLLLQLSASPALIWPWASRYERVYFWIDRERLEAGDLSEVVAVAQ